MQQVSQLTQALASRDQQAEEAAALLRKVAEAKNLALAANEAAKAVHAEQLRRLNGLLEQANARAGTLEAEADALRPEAARAPALEQRSAELARQLGEARAALERARAGEAAAHKAAADAAAELQRKASEVRRRLGWGEVGTAQHPRACG